MTFKEFVWKWGECINWLQYSSLVKAIPSEWKQVIRQDESSIENLAESHYEKLMAYEKWSRLAYTELNNETDFTLVHERINQTISIVEDDHQKLFLTLIKSLRWKNIGVFNTGCFKMQ